MRVSQAWADSLPQSATGACLAASTPKQTPLSRGWDTTASITPGAHPLAAPQQVQLRQPSRALPRPAGAGGIDRLALADLRLHAGRPSRTSQHHGRRGGVLAAHAHATMHAGVTQALPTLPRPRTVLAIERHWGPGERVYRGTARNRGAEERAPTGTDLLLLLRGRRPHGPGTRADLMHARIGRRCRRRWAAGRHRRAQGAVAVRLLGRGPTLELPRLHLSLVVWLRGFLYVWRLDQLCCLSHASNSVVEGWRVVAAPLGQDHDGRGPLQVQTGAAPCCGRPQDDALFLWALAVHGCAGLASCVWQCQICQAPAPQRLC